VPRNRSISRISKGLLNGRQVHAVTDTNVIIAATSVHDLWNEYGKHPGRVVGPTTDTPDGPMRRQRARDALLLLEYLHDRRLTTYSPLGSEFLRVMPARVAPESGDFPTLYITIFAHHVRWKIFPGWTDLLDETDKGVKGSDCDRHLVHKANLLGVPVISYEGAATGAVCKASQKAGVRVMTPREFWGPHAAEDDLVQAFANRWMAARDALWREVRPKYTNESGAAWVLNRMDDYLKHVLLDGRRQRQA
jgi:hypothetical protein